MCEKLTDQSVIDPVGFACLKAMENIFEPKVIRLKCKKLYLHQQEIGKHIGTNYLCNQNQV